MDGMIEVSLKLLDDEGFCPPGKTFERSFGILVLEIAQGGLLLSGQIGSGILLRHDRESKTWGPPLAMGMVGLGVGVVFGAEKRHLLLFLTEEEMDLAASSDFTVRLGAQASMLARELPNTENEGKQNIESDDCIVGGESGYSSTLGYYVGLEATVVVVAPRKAVNKQFYGESLKAKEIVYGKDKNTSESLDRLHAKLAKLAEPRQRPVRPPMRQDSSPQMVLQTSTVPILVMRKSQASDEETKKPLIERANRMC